MTRVIRILHLVSGDLWAGAEVQAYTLIDHLQRRPGVEVGAMVMNPGILANKLAALGIRVEVLDETRLNAAEIVLRMLRYIKAWRPDVIHTHRDKENILGSLANGLGRRAPIIRTQHGGEEHRGAVGWRAVRRRLVAGVDRSVQRVSGQTTIAVSETLRADLVERLPNHRVVVIENGVDIEGFRAQVGTADDRQGNPDVAHIGIVGRLVPVKRVDLFLEMAALLHQQYPDRSWAFDVVGDGAERAKLGALCDRLGIADRVTFHGHRQDIATCLAGLDVLVMCSDHEGMPMTALEAAALAVPTVAHAVGGLTEVVPNEFQVTRHDPVGYRAGVLRALRADARRITSTHAMRILTRFSAERNAERTLALYRQVMSPEATV